MDISKEQFFLATSKLGISEKQAEALWASLENRNNDPQPSTFSMLMFYVGAVIIISAMAWFIHLGWEWFGGGAIFLISTAYAFLFAWIGAKLWSKENLRIPAGLLMTIAVCMTPLAIYGLETYLGFWPRNYLDNYQDFFYTIRSNWILMEVGTMLAGLIALRFFPFPFLTVPIFFSAWLLAKDMVSLVVGNEITGEQREWTSLCFGLALIFISYLIQRKKREDYAFWGYLFGTLVFWTSLTSLSWDKGEVVLFLYFIINLIMMVVSILLKKKIFMLCGVIGIFIYLGHLAYTIFEDSLLFPFVLSFIGLAVIYLGVIFQRNFEWIEKKIIERIPTSIRRLFS